MRILLWGLVLFIDSFILHLIIWKIRVPVKQTNALLLLFFGNLFFCFAMFLSIRSFFPIYSQLIPSAPFEYLRICILFAALTLAYIITYSAIEVDSPSLIIVLAIDKAGKSGLEKSKLENFLTDEFLVVPRAMDLVRDRLIYSDNNRFKLTTKGRLFVAIFIFWRKLMKRKIGG